MTEDDKTEAMKLFRLTAELGNAEAQSRLCLCYKYGKDVKDDNRKAIKWFRLAVDQGNTMAYLSIG